MIICSIDISEIRFGAALLNGNDEFPYLGHVVTVIIRVIAQLTSVEVY